MRAAVTAVLLVALGGAAGSAGRAAIALALPGSPLAATLLVNVVGAFALGLLVAVLDVAAPGVRRERRHHARLLLGTGFCGGFTTYSAVALQVAELARDSDLFAAAGYAMVTVGVGAGVTLAGLFVGTRFTAGRAV